MSHGVTAGRLNRITAGIIGAAIRVHRALGPGLLESAYRMCLVYELKCGEFLVETERAVPLTYGALTIACAYRADLIVERLVIVEGKALPVVAPIHARQLQTYAQLTDCRVGLLLNFGAPMMRDGVIRIVNRFPDA
jgi:GxxExxY protein